MVDTNRPSPSRTAISRRVALGGAAAVAATWSAGAIAARLPSRLVAPASGSAPAQRLGRAGSVATFDPALRYVALFGHPGTPVLGALGEQGPAAAAERVRGLAADYAQFGVRVVPTFELIGSVAAATAGADDDYSTEFGVETFLPFIGLAAQQGIHVVIDLQPGRSPFDQQIREYEAHVAFAHVSVALDPEWRGDPPFQPGGGRIGTVDAAEVNRTVQWLDALIRRRGLPPKMLLLHQFTPSMITGKQLIRGTANVQIVVQMDGFGTLAMKRRSWQMMVDDLPPGALTGWKNFVDEDLPTPTPAETLENTPAPTYVSYH